MAVQNSINTNPGAFTALRTLNSINRGLDTVQNRVSTGLKVGGAGDSSEIPTSGLLQTRTCSVSSSVQTIRSQ